MTPDDKNIFDGLINGEGEEQNKRSPWTRLRGYFLAGILVTAPIGITIFLTWKFFAFIDAAVKSLIPPQYIPPESLLPGIGVAIAVFFFLIIGFLATNFLGRLFIRMAEYIVDRVPVIRTLYGAIKQIFETVMASQSQAFRDVVMIEYPRKGIYALGFLTGTTEGEVQKLTDDSVLNVFVPTTPNPTSGFLLFFPKKDVHFLDMTVEEGIKMVVSAGIITPPYKVNKGVKNAKKKN